MFRSPEELQIAELRYIEGFKQGEIAKRTGLSQSTVSRALAIFTDSFKQLGLDPDRPEQIREAVAIIIHRASKSHAA